MADYLWSSTVSTDPTLGANWTKSDGTTGTAPTTGDTATIASIPGVTVASIGASGGMGNPPTTLTSSGAASVGGNLAQSTNYFYKVTTLYATGESVPSAELSYATPASGTATNLIVVNWVAPVVPGGTITGYKIYRSTTTGTELYLASVGVVLSYTDNSATVPTGPMPGAATLTSLTISQTFSGTIGTAGLGGYWQVNATTVNIGAPGAGIPGVGSAQVKLDNSSIQTTWNVFNSGQSTTGYEPVMLKGSHASNVLNAMGGTTGIGTTQPGELTSAGGTITVATINATGNGTTVNAGSSVVLTTLNVASGASILTNSAATTCTVSSGSTANLKGSGAVTTINNTGTVYHNIRNGGTGSTTINNFPGGTVDFSGQPAAVTIGTMNIYPGSTCKRNPANPSHLTITTRALVECGLETFS